jgi:hypothetical protein
MGNPSIDLKRESEQSPGDGSAGALKRRVS